MSSGPSDATSVEASKRYWDLQNYISGFSVGQAVVTVLAIAGSTGLQSGVGRWWRAILCIIVTTGLVYVAAVIGAFFAERKVGGGRFAAWNPWGLTLLARVAAIVGVQIFVGAVLNHLRG